MDFLHKSSNDELNDTHQQLVQEKVKNEVCDSFWAYRQYMHPTLKLGWFQRDVAKHLQTFYEALITGKRPKLVIQAPPQHGKSVQIMDFIAWLSGMNPNLKTIYASFSERLGSRANRALQRTYRSENFQRIFPNIQLKGTCTNQFLEYTGYDGYFRNTTVAGSITGETLDLGVIDDPIKGREEANSQVIRDKVWDWFTDDFFTRFSQDAGFLAILTRWHVDDPIGRLIEKMDDVKVLTYAAIAIVDEYDEEGALLRRKGEALFPEHKPLSFLLERKKAMPEANWEALYQQHPVISDGNLFKVNALQMVNTIPSGYIQWVRGWDLASSIHGDFTAGALLGKLEDGRFIIADMQRVQYGPDERDALMLKMSQTDPRTCLISIPQDPGQAGKTQVMYLSRKLAGKRIKASPESGDKVTRALPLASQINMENVLLLKGRWNQDLVEEMRLFPNGKHDDQIDALSRAFSELVNARPPIRMS